MSYTLDLRKSYDSYEAGVFTCGLPNQMGGLAMSLGLPFDIGDVPFQELVEIPLVLTNTGLCNEYKRVTLSLTATCEKPDSHSHVYQVPFVLTLATPSRPAFLFPLPILSSLCLSLLPA